MFIKIEYRIDDIQHSLSFQMKINEMMLLCNSMHSFFVGQVEVRMKATKHQFHSVLKFGVEGEQRNMRDGVRGEKYV